MRGAVHPRWGGTEGNELLTIGAAVVLTVLLVVEGITIIWMGGLVTVHLFVGMVLIPPVALKLGSTGYRFARYYLGSPVYRAKGPPLLPLRLLAPVLVLTTLLVFATGVWLPDHRVEMTASHAGSIPSPRCGSGSAPGLRTAYLRARLIARGLVSTRGTACAARR